MVKWIFTLMPVLLLSGCGRNIDDLQAYIGEVQANAQVSIEPIPKVKEYKSFEYSVANTRSPFVQPTPELIEDSASLAMDCLQPDFSRPKEQLERFPLDTIRMRGTLGEKDKYFALTSVADGELYRVTVGNYIGLFHGKIVKIMPDKIMIKEMFPDGTGCWETREAEISIFGKGANSGSK